MFEVDYGKVAEAVRLAERGVRPPDPVGGLDCVDVENTVCHTAGKRLRVAIFNMERGVQLPMILTYLKYHPSLRNVDIILANELDYGMARSGNRYVAREIAAELGMNFAFGVEFLSVYAGMDGNERGLHGNAIFSKLPLRKVELQRLPVVYDWFYDRQKRLYNRIALYATVEFSGQCVALCCTHLENQTTPFRRLEQMRALLDKTDLYADGLPAIIGGDMNTNTVNSTADDLLWLAGSKELQRQRLANVPAYEPLMNYAADRGYSYADCNIPAKTTRRRPEPGYPDTDLNLDWFFQRGFACSDPVRVEGIFNHKELAPEAPDLSEFDGRLLSDHDAVITEFEIIS